MIEDMHDIELDPKQVFGLEVSEGEIQENSNELSAGIPGIKESWDSGDRTIVYTHYALYYASKEGLEGVDLFSYAGLVAGLVTGLHGGFSTDQYKKEIKIQDQALDILNVLRVTHVDPIHEAQVMVKWCLDEYQREKPENLVRKTVTLRPDQITDINQLPGNFSENLRQIIDAGLKN
jgi:hypothetical protein